MAKAQNQTMTMLCRAFLSIMCAFIAKTTPKNLSHAINVRDKILATSELTEKRKEKRTVNRGTKINNDRCISTWYIYIGTAVEKVETAIIVSNTSDRTSCDTSNNVCWFFQNWRNRFYRQRYHVFDTFSWLKQRGEKQWKRAIKIDNNWCVY